MHTLSSLFTDDMVPMPISSFEPAAASVVAVFIILALVFGSYIVMSLAYMFLFEKLGIEKWKAWVPVYSTWVFNEAGSVRGVWSLAMLAGAIPFVGWIVVIVGSVANIIAAHQLGRGFRKGGGWTVLYVFFPIIWMFILGLNKDQHEADLQAPKFVM